MNQNAFLSHKGKYTSFVFGDTKIRFRTSDKLLRYEKVKEWDHGYIVVDSTYSTMGTVEEYIDLVPILEDLMFDPKRFLAPIKGVSVRYDDPA